MPTKKDLLANGAAGFFSKPANSPAAKPAPVSRAEAPASAPVSAKRTAPVIGRGRPRKDDDSSSAWPKERGRLTSICFDNEQYLKIGEIAYSERLSIKETVFLLLSEGISRYEKTGKLKK